MISAIRTLWRAGLLAAALAGRADAQLVQEGVHSIQTGPAEMCGLTGRDAGELIERARTSPALRPTPIESEWFELFVSIEGMDQLVVTRPGEPAHPAASCRHVYQDAAGDWFQERDMRCDAGRPACDRLFLELQALDEQLRQSLSGDL